MKESKIPETWGLGLTELEKIYQVEVEQANKLRNASALRRKQLYSIVYEEYFRLLPIHPQFTIKQNETLKQSRVDYQLRQILPFIQNKKSFVEIGAGDCSLSIAASKYCSKVFALEVSNNITDNLKFPSNVQLVLCDGFNFPFEANTIDIAYSNQLMEHLHPEDAKEQLKNIFRMLKPNGIYICITPNRISGPHDISRFFTDKPVGFHLREYSATDLQNIFLKAGFKKAIAYTILKGKKVELPFLLVKLIERIAETLNTEHRKSFLNFRLVSIIFNAVIAAVK